MFAAAKLKKKRRWRKRNGWSSAGFRPHLRHDFQRLRTRATRDKGPRMKKDQRASIFSRHHCVLLARSGQVSATRKANDGTVVHPHPHQRPRQHLKGKKSTQNRAVSRPTGCVCLSLIRLGMDVESAVLGVPTANGWRSRAPQMQKRRDPYGTMPGSNGGADE